MNNSASFPEEVDGEKLFSALFLFLLEKEEAVSDGGDVGVGMGGIFSTRCTTCCRKGNLVRGKLCGAAGGRETGEGSFLLLPVGVGKGRGVVILYRLLVRIEVEEKKGNRKGEERVECIPPRQPERFPLQL